MAGRPASFAMHPQRHLTEDQVAHFRDAFHLFDADGGGSIDAEELGACLRSLGQNLSETEIHEMIVEWDFDDKGTISFEGFLAMISSLTDVMDIEKELHFGSNPCSFDRNAFGEMTQVIGGATAFMEFDQRQSGKILKEDFMAIFTMQTDSYRSQLVPPAELENILNAFDAIDPKTQEVDYNVVIRKLLRT